jgi:hypothetical protein
MARHHIRWNAARRPAIAGGAAARPFNLAQQKPRESLKRQVRESFREL